MLSNIQEWTVAPDRMDITYNNGDIITVQGDMHMLFKKHRLSNVHATLRNLVEHTATITISQDQIVITGNDFTHYQFFPHEMFRCIMKDFRKDRAFMLSYRKHLVYDYSKDHYNLVVPFEIPAETKEKAIEIVRSHSTGKLNKPTGVVLDECVVVVVGDCNYTYWI